MPIAYKLTDQNMQTFNGFQWALNKPVETDGKGSLCGLGWLHFYQHPLLAVLHNPIHARIEHPRLFKARVSGKCLSKDGMKVGYTGATLIKELPLPELTANQIIAYGIYTILCVYRDKFFIEWAKDWLSGKDRTARTADAADAAAWTVAMVAEAAAWTAWAAAGVAENNNFVDILIRCAKKAMEIK